MDNHLMFIAIAYAALAAAEAARVEAEQERKRLESMTHEQRMEYWARKQAQATERLARAAENPPRQDITIHHLFFS